MHNLEAQEISDRTPKDYIFVAFYENTSHCHSNNPVRRWKGSSLSHSARGSGRVGLVIEPVQVLSAARPINPQGSYNYGKINITRTIKFVNSAGSVDGKLRYAVNGVSHIDPETPVKLAEYFGVAKYSLISDEQPSGAGDKITMAPNVITAIFRNFVQIIFENHEKSVQLWHLDGYSFFPVA
ncbi:hypothetical protein F511_09760 [Dorcoceras hygrometricum]|uniref:Plastocyanin-like domain-containing protein n=1 Tax=Dorcoceras hygrometricum TaxID=472368 RepID=A0A2Z7D4U1_9LAMI|nr:hypothetical protein F511_09760 [Dorcoceras hygrometricum]